MKKICVFPGQGSQAVGMGKDLCDTFKEAREVFEEVDNALDFKLSEVIFNGDSEKLTQTQNAQPALMAMSMAVWRVVQKETGLKITDFAYAAGHSLGEYSALCAAGALPLPDAALILRMRGQSMAKAAEVEKGSMAAILGLDALAIETLTDETGTFIANDNSLGQIVISGPVARIEKACEKAKQMGAKRALPLNVAGAFHCPLMQSAADEMKAVLAEAPFVKPEIPVISNVLALPVSDVEQIKELLYQQITEPVKWTQSVQWLEKNGVDTALEMGAGKVLSGLIKRTTSNIQTQSISDVASLEEFKNTL